VGDQILRVVAARCRLVLREADLIGRYGGDEFAILVLENDIDVAASVAERLRRHIDDAPIETQAGLVYVTISLGVAALSERCPNLPMLLNEADAALYTAKKAGRNCVKLAGRDAAASA
jgi:diguanylate cyclase (GGDEF)-like protein